MKRFSFSNLMLVLGLLFIYLPMLILVIYSFNASKLVTVWGGWSTHWYAELIADAPLVESAFISLRLALVSATAATILGMLAALALVRFGRFRGRAVSQFQNHFRFNPAGVFFVDHVFQGGRYQNLNRQFQ